MRILIFGILCAMLINYMQLSASSKPYKGNAILGNGNVCLVYSDDQRIIERSGKAGIQHLYFKDYSVDYIKGTSFRMLGNKSNIPLPTTAKSTSLQTFYKTKSVIKYTGGLEASAYCSVSYNDAICLSYTTKGVKKESLEICIEFRNEFTGNTTVKALPAKVQAGLVLLHWDNGMQIACRYAKEFQVSVNDSAIVLTSKNPKLTAFSVYLVPAASETELQQKLKTVDQKNFDKSIDNHWNKWLVKSLSEESQASNDSGLLESYKRTIYAAKSACLNGMVPADMTGQFVTNNMPQLYPRDAMKSARVFLNLGYKEEARSIINYWCGNIPKKSKGEFYARYDALGQAVNSGSGARFDEPEWDANGYLIQLLNWYYQKYGEWLAPKNFLYELADFVVDKIDDEGLLYEGGIVEWTGYLPTTNMICSAALTTIATIAADSNDTAESEKYNAAAKRIADNLFKTYDLEKNAYTAVRYYAVKDDNKSLTQKTGEKLFLWDGTMQFGALWGFPIHPMLQSTIRFYEESIIKAEGGMQYFEAKDNAFLTAYGSDLFFFSTAALAQYYALFEGREKALHHITWMQSNANIYGLMPERIYSNYSDCSEASPLTWCNAEYAAAVHLLLTK